MHGFIDSFPVPLHLPYAAPLAKATVKGKGKAVEVGTVYDVVQSWTSQEHDEMQRKVALAAELGYSTVVLTLSLPPTFNPQQLSYPTPLFPELDVRTAPAGTEGVVLQLWRVEVSSYDEEAVKGASVKGIYGFANSTAPLYGPSTSMLSTIPTDLFAFSHCCLALSPPSPFAPSLLTFDPSTSPRLGFPLKRGPVNTAQRSGLQFEIVYSGILRQDDPGVAGSGNRRKNWIAGAREIVRATGGVGIVLSSGATQLGEMRAPADMINLCTLIGLTPAQAKDALTVNPQRAIIRGLSMRQSYRGIISNPTLTTTFASAPEVGRSNVPVAGDTTKRLASQLEGGAVSSGKRKKDVK